MCAPCTTFTSFVLPARQCTSTTLSVIVRSQGDNTPQGRAGQDGGGQAGEEDGARTSAAQRKARQGREKGCVRAYNSFRITEFAKLMCFEFASVGGGAAFLLPPLGGAVSLLPSLGNVLFSLPLLAGTAPSLPPCRLLFSFSFSLGLVPLRDLGA